MSKMIVKPKRVMLNGTPMSRNAEARECGSVPRLRVPRMRERKARKVVNAGNAERRAGMSGMIVKPKTVVLNSTPMSRNAMSKMIMETRMIVKPNRVVLNGTPMSRNAMSKMFPQAPYITSHWPGCPGSRKFPVSIL